MQETLTKNRFKVAIVSTQQPKYPEEAPYNPSIQYPEYPFPTHIAKEPNYVYDGVRTLFCELGLDSGNRNKSKWNPLGRLIQPGMTVVIKPNFVLSNATVPHLVHNDPVGLKTSQRRDIFSIITHPSVLRAIVDYCWVALKGKGRIIIADAPNYNCNFEELLSLTKLRTVAEFVNSFNGPRLEIFDLRDYWSKTRHFPSMIRPLPGDPDGKVTINLGRESALYDHPNPSRLYGAVYHRKETILNHTGERQRYELSRTILGADVVISVPKLKTHKMVGITCNIKNFVGACTNKNYIAHYTLGCPSEGGDQYPDGLFTETEHAVITFERWMYDTFLSKSTRRHEYIHRLIYGFLYLKLLKPLGLGIPVEKRQLDAGSWYGNDTAWRMAVDLAKIMHFADKDGKLHATTQRRLFSVVDGVIGGENNGPLSPDAKGAGLLLAGDNFLAVDIVATRLMGFDPLKLKQFTMLDRKYDFGPCGLDDIWAVGNDETVLRRLKDNNDHILAFKPHPGWIGHIEIGGTPAEMHYTEEAQA